MTPSAFRRSAAELLEAAERRKYVELRTQLGIPDGLKIEGFQLDSLAHFLIGRTGPVEVKLEGETLHVGNPQESGRLNFHGDAITFLLKKWGVTREQAQQGHTFVLS